jgi:hypothetical protein
MSEEKEVIEQEDGKVEEKPMPTEEAPKEEVPAEETPAEEAPKEEPVPELPAKEVAPKKEMIGEQFGYTSVDDFHKQITSEENMVVPGGFEAN